MVPLGRLVGVVMAVGLAIGCAPSEEMSSNEAGGEMSEAEKNELAVIEVQGFGEIRLRFFPDKAPRHVENLKKLAREGFYDGVTFHRIVPGFVIQGGDPNTKDANPDNDGTGGPGHTIEAEFNDTPHRRGILSMARKADPDSAGSQFFIIVKDSPFLDGKYTAFGELVTGEDTLDKIATVPVGGPQGSTPKEPVHLKAVIVQPAFKKR